jgi:hypothetical protein
LLSNGDRFGGPEELGRWDTLLRGLISGHELLISRSLSPTGVEREYTLRLGRLLQREAELTRPCFATDEWP